MIQFRSTRPRPQASYTVRPFRPSDRSAFLSLYERVFGQERDTEWFRWKFERNPYVDHVPIIVAERDGELVGARSFFAQPIRNGETVFPAFQPCDTMVHPDHQRQGLFDRMNELALERYVGQARDPAFCFNFPNEHSKQGNINYGWQDVGTVPMYYRPQDPGTVLRAVTGGSERANTARSTSAPKTAGSAGAPDPENSAGSTGSAETTASTVAADPTTATETVQSSVSKLATSAASSLRVPSLFQSSQPPSSPPSAVPSASASTSTSSSASPTPSATPSEATPPPTDPSTDTTATTSSRSVRATDRVAQSLTTAVPMVHRVGDRLLLTADSGLTVEQYDRPPAAVLASISRRSIPAGFHTDRSERFYRWRFDRPNRSYPTYVARRDGHPVAALVTAPASTAAGDSVRLVETLPRDLDAATDALESLLVRALGDARERAFVTAFGQTLPKPLRYRFYPDTRFPLSTVLQPACRTLLVRDLVGDDARADANTASGIETCSAADWCFSRLDLDTT
ncbi:hypothetical protein C482_06874 [Natrialba chahannaoensis JCM 10990]|uniref:N-acetyltransferase domain-containing protein n=2 Tax=Natrialba chahannaoensis TaxID=68911 RepID=M0AT21_9EURY|nr:hypothetical protein C482_06874 [Natrialba chahannaoensis JCM 10990]